MTDTPTLRTLTMTPERWKALEPRHFNLNLTPTDVDDMRREAEAQAARVAELEAELGRWKICENCGEPLAGPGICDKAVGEHAKGLELMHDETLTRAEQAEAEVQRLTRERDEAERAKRLAVASVTAAPHESVNIRLRNTEKDLHEAREEATALRRERDTLRAQLDGLQHKLEQWEQQGWTDNETPLDGYGKEVVREVIAAAASTAGVRASDPSMGPARLSSGDEPAAATPSKAEQTLTALRAWAQPDEPLSLVGDPFQRGYLTAKVEALALLRETP